MQLSLTGMDSDAQLWRDFAVAWDAHMNKTQKGRQDRKDALVEVHFFIRSCSWCGAAFRPFTTFGRKRRQERNGDFLATKARFCSRLCVNRAQTYTKYGLTGSEIRAQLERQNGKCAGPWCRKPLPPFEESWTGAKFGVHIDHCHRTGRNRGILCGECNLFLGHIEKFWHELPAMMEYANGGVW